MKDGINLNMDGKMASNSEYEQRRLWEENKLTERDIKDYMEQLSKQQENSPPLFIILTESQYDYFYSIFGEGCGWDSTKVKVLRGYPKFDI